MCADIVFISLGLAGVAALREVSPEFYWALRLGSLAYVIFLASKMWRRPPPTEEEELEVAERPTSGLLGNLQFTLFAFLTTISNPKGLLFVFGIFPSFIPAEGDFTWGYAGILIATFMTLSVTVAGTWGLLASFALGGLAKWPHLGKLSAILILAAVGWVWLPDVMGLWPESP